MAPVNRLFNTITEMTIEVKRSLLNIQSAAVIVLVTVPAET